MTQPSVCRSYLYVAGSDSLRIDKAYATEADAIVLDLEDAVPPDRKDAARRNVAAVLRSRPPKPTFVRVSALPGPDLGAITGASLAGIRLSKISSVRAVRSAAAALRGAGTSAELHVLVESALGVERAYALATADSLVSRIMLGEADLRADLRVTCDEGLGYARMRVVSVSRAAGLPGPVQSVYTNVRDTAGLVDSTRWGRSVGFLGRSAVHPAQVGPINEVFSPSAAEVSEAAKVLSALAESAREGRGAMLLSDGQFVDEAVAASARWTIALAKEAGT